MTQQTIRMIEEYDKEAFSYQSTEKYQHENMMVFGRHRNIMIISYQKAALKLLTGDNRFMDFLSRVRYAVFDEAHYLIDDSLFNRPVLKLLKKKQRSDRIVAGDEKWIIKKS